MSLVKCWVSPAPGFAALHSVLSAKAAKGELLDCALVIPDEHLVGERSNFKNFLCTRKIMVMHSNEREECCLHTLVDRKRKR